MPLLFRPLEPQNPTTFQPLTLPSAQEGEKLEGFRDVASEIVSDVGITVGTFVESAVEDLTFGIAKPDIISEQEERENPYASKIGHTSGSVAGFVGSMMVAKGTLGILPVTGKVLKFASTVARNPQAQAGVRAFAGVTSGALLGGFHGLVTETVNQVREKDPSLIDIGVKAVEEAAFFGITGGVNSLAQFQPRIARGLADGTAFATTTTLIKLVRGQVLTPEDVGKDFLIGTAFGLILSRDRTKPNARELDLKIANELKQYIETTKNLTLKDFTKETKRLLGDDRDVVKTLTEMFSGFKRQLVSPRGRKTFINQKIAKQNTFLREAPQEFKKEGNNLKRIFSIEIKKVPGLEKSKGGKKGKVDKVQRELYESILQDSFGVKTTKDLTFGQLDYAIRELKQFNNAVENGRLGSLDVSGIKSPGITAPFTPGPSMINTMHAQFLTGNIQNAAKREILYQNKLLRYSTYLDKTFLDKGGVSQSRRIGEFVKGKRNPELTKLIDALNTNPKKNPKKFAEILSTMTEEQIGVFKEYRAMYDAELHYFNLGQQYFGKPKVKGIEGYIRHRRYRSTVPELTATEQGGSGSLRPKGVAQVKEKLSPEFKRTSKDVDINELLNTPSELFMDLIRHNTKRTIIEAPLEQFKTDMRVLGKAIPRGAKDYLTSHVNHVILGHPRQFDILANATIKNLGIDKVINKVANTMGRDLGSSPIHKISGVYGKTMNAAWISFRADLGIRNYFQRFLSLGLYDTKSNLKAMVPGMDPFLEKMAKNNPFMLRTKDISFEAAGSTVSSGVIGKVGRAPMTITHSSNIFHSMMAAGHQIKELIMNPKFKKHGWASPERVAGKKPNNGTPYFDSELKLIKLEMEAAGTATQYDYSKLGAAPFQQSAGGRMLFKFWSWPVNYSFNYWREMASRAIQKRPSYSGPNGPTLPLRMRAGPIRHIAFSSAMIGAAGKAGIDLSSVGMGLSLDPTDVVRTGPLPDRGTPLIQLMQNLHTWVTSDDAFDKKKAFNSLNYFMNPATYVPGSAAIRKLTKAAKDEDVLPLFFRPKRKK